MNRNRTTLRRPPGPPPPLLLHRQLKGGDQVVVGADAEGPVAVVGPLIEAGAAHLEVC